MFFQSSISLSGHLSYFFKVVRLIFSLQNQSYRTLIASFHFPAIKKVLFLQACIHVFQVANPIRCCQKGQKGQKLLVRKVIGWNFTSQCNSKSNNKDNNVNNIFILNPHILTCHYNAIKQNETG